MMSGDHYTECNIDSDEQDLKPQRTAPPPPPPAGAEKPPVPANRDPRGINDYLKVDFSNVLAEPASFHSFDKVWTWSDILFEASKLWCYRIISLLCAIPVSLFSGFLFAFLGCLHIWCAMPCIQLCTVCMPPVRILWAGILDLFIAPLCTSVGQCCSRIYMTVSKA
ncbi:caveolin-2-like [Ambystoma mexicanum]|uniref:caveolin-2-like n=1 Tax=Ambystoma mexicanum TaxID=8296 RepID=UPI0037E88D9F